MVSDHFLQAAAGSTCSGPLPITASPATVGSSGSILNASAKGGAWRTKPAETAVSRSLPAWPLRDGAFSGTSGGAALAAYPRDIARCEQGVLYGCGPAQVGFGATCSPPFFTSPFVLLVNLVRATAAHAPFQGAKTGVAASQGARLRRDPCMLVKCRRPRRTRREPTGRTLPPWGVPRSAGERQRAGAQRDAPRRAAARIPPPRLANR